MCCCWQEALAIMDGRRVVVYEITGGSIPFRAAGSFETASQFMCMYEMNLYTLEPGKIQVRNFQVRFKHHPYTVWLLVIINDTCMIQHDRRV